MLARTAEAKLPRDSPRHGDPYRRGLTGEVSVGVALCQPALLYRGVCGPRGGPPAAPGVALRLGMGWRINQYLLVSWAWVRQNHRPGGGFTSGVTDGGILVARGIVPLATRDGRDTHLDLGFELGLGWSRRELLRDAAPNRLTSNGALLRPALILDGWVLADLALGLEFAAHLNMHWQHCVDDDCQVAPGAWVASDLERRWVDGFSIAVRATGLVFTRF